MLNMVFWRAYFAVREDKERRARLQCRTLSMASIDAAEWPPAATTVALIMTFFQRAARNEITGAQ